MMPITRHELEVLLDTPDRRDYVVSAFADLRVKDGFRHFAETHQKNQLRAAHAALSETEARRVLDANFEPVLGAVAAADPAARGLAVFSGVKRGLFHVVNLDFPVDNQLVIDEEPFILPLLERWFGDPSYLVAVINSRHLHLFEAHSGVAEKIEKKDRETPEMQRDKPRMTYQNRFSKAFDENLQGLDQDPFLKDCAATVAENYSGNGFTGLILLGPAELTAALRRLLPKMIQNEVVEEHPQSMTSRPDDVADDVARAMEHWRAGREQSLLHELGQRWKEKRLVANGPTEVLDALQQGRVTQIIFGTRRDFGGAECRACGYRFGAPTGQCPYCGGETRTVNAAQKILRMALRHRVPVYLFPRGLKNDPLANAGGLCALLRAEANWAPNKTTADASQSPA